MKKTLLLAAVATLSLGANAQGWEKPTLPEGSEVVSGNKYCIMNVAASQNEDGAAYLLSGGQSWYGWSTSTVLVNGSTTEPETFTLTETEKGWTFARNKDGKYTFISGKTVGGFENSGEMHVDQGSLAENLRYFGIVNNGNYYRIHAAKDNTAQGITVFDENGDPTLFWGWKTDNLNGESNNFPWAVYGTVSPDAGFACDWEFINPSDYLLYSARTALFNQYVATLDYTIDCSDEQAIYDNVDATVDELKDARISLAKKLAIAKATAKLAGASEENPIDATELLENPDFSAGNINGWVCTFVSGTTANNIGYQQNKVYTGPEWTDDETGESGVATLNKFIEAWAATWDANMKRNGNSFSTVGDGKLYQTIYGLPAGKYKLSCNAIAVQQDDAADQNPVTGVQLYAVAGEFDNYKNMATGNGIPEHFIMEFIHGGGDVELGLRTQNATANWIGADDFKIVYYGELKLNPYQVLLNNAVAEAEDTYTDMDAVKASAEAKNAYTSALEAAKAAEDEQEDAYYQTLQTNLENAIEGLKVSANLINQVTVAMAAVEEKIAQIENHYGITCATAAEAVDTYATDIENGFKTEAQIKLILDALTTDIAAVFTNDILTAQDATSATVNSPVDVTPVIANATYDWNESNRSAYWTNTGKAPHGWNTNGVAEDGSTFVVGEVWQGTFTHTQQIVGLIPGFYCLQVNAFQRGAGNDEHSAQAATEEGEPLPASLFAGEESTPVASVFSEVDKYAEHCTAEDGTIPGAIIKTGKFEGKVVPNNMDQATKAFNQGLYVNLLQFEVKEGQDVIEFGLSRDSKQSNDWVIFGNWNLKYYGTENPNIATEITSVEADSAARAIYDLTGRKVSKAVKGIYVINNKKVIK